MKLILTSKIIFFLLLEALLFKKYVSGKNNGIRGSTISYPRKQQNGRRIELNNQGNGNGEKNDGLEIPFVVEEITDPKGGQKENIKERPVQKNKVGKKSKGKERVDKKGNKHQRFEVTINDIPIFGYQEVVHQNQGDGIERVTKNPMPDLIDFDTVPTITEEDAMKTAIDFVEGDVDVIDTNLNVLILDDVPILVFNVATKQLNEDGLLIGQPLVFVEAHINRVFHVVETLENYDAASVLTDSKKVTYSTSSVIGDSSDPVLLAIHNHVQTVLDFLNSVGYNSYDNNGGQVKSWGHFGFVNNAFYVGKGKFYYGDGDGISHSYFGVLDIVAHEIGHAVTDYSSGLIYENESGAINEGASDILGVAVTAFAEGKIDSETWFIGEDVTLGQDVRRFFDEPSRDGLSRDHYTDKFTESWDSGGVHFNSGILNHWFYLLVVGGHHHNAMYQTGEVIKGIGMDAAFDIWFHTWTTELIPSSDFEDARKKTLISCYDLGYHQVNENENSCISVQNAWAEVGLGNVYVTPGEISNIICNPGEIMVQIYITTDQYADTDNRMVFHHNEQTFSEDSFRQVTQYDPYEFCLKPDLCHRFWFVDEKGNGFSTVGSFLLKVDGEIKINNDRDFGYGYAEKFGNCPPLMTLVVTLKTDLYGNLDNYLIARDRATNKVIYDRLVYGNSKTHFDIFDFDGDRCVLIEVGDSYGDGILYITDALMVMIDSTIQYKGKLPGYGLTFEFGKGC